MEEGTKKPEKTPVPTEGLTSDSSKEDSGKHVRIRDSNEEIATKDSKEENANQEQDGDNGTLDLSIDTTQGFSEEHRKPEETIYM